MASKRRRLQNESTMDILAIDVHIRSYLVGEQRQLPEYVDRLHRVRSEIKQPNVPVECAKIFEKEESDLVQKVTILQDSYLLNMYIAETAWILLEYKNLLATPIYVAFFRSLSSATESDTVTCKKSQLIREYLEIAIKYIKRLRLESILQCVQDIPTTPTAIGQTGTCANCNNTSFDTTDDTSICLSCGCETQHLRNIRSYRDTQRINITSKYTYDRRVHFRDCINQYQGKQNSSIPDKVYSDLMQQLAFHNLLNTDQSTRFHRVTREHISMFLKELGHMKHYENINLIHSHLTGQKADDISHLEHLLLLDFDKLTEVYDRLFKHLQRKNFINTQYVLFQLLSRYKHPCKKEDFVILKTIDRKAFHDDICRVLFEELGWNMIPFF